MTTPKDVFDIGPTDRRQKAIDSLEIGDTISISRRVDVTFGVDNDDLSKLAKQIRNALDTQTGRSRKKFPRREYTVENGSFVCATAAAVMLVCTVTRLG